MTASSQGIALYFILPQWDRATTAMIENGRWVPFVALSVVLGAVALPLAFGRVTDAAKIVLPFLPGAKKE